jgi:hypothetical protein
MGRAPAETMMNLQIGVAQSQFPELERHLNEGVLESPPQENIFRQLSARS